MIQPAFSTIACPEWTLEQVADHASAYGFEAVELRTFGDRSTPLACEPTLTGVEKVRAIFGAKGIDIVSVGTSLRFDGAINPPVIGHALPGAEHPVSAAKRAIDLAAAVGCPLVRVFGFEVPRGEKRASAIARIVERLELAVDHARNTGVKLVIENGGSFSKGSELAELLDQLRDPLIGACYALATAERNGEPFKEGLAALSDRVWAARIKDFKGETPCMLGEGDLPCRAFVAALAASGFNGPVVYEWDRLWVPGLAEAGKVLPQAARVMFQWMGAKMGVGLAGATA